MKITIRLQKKRYRGKSRSGLSHSFLTAGYGGKWFNIPDKAIIEWKEYNRDNFEMLEVTFEDWAVKLGDFGRDLEYALEHLEKQTFAQVIR